MDPDDALQAAVARLRASCDPDAVRLERERLVASRDAAAAWGRTRSTVGPLLLLALHDAVVDGAVTLDTWRRALNLLADHTVAVEVTADALRHLRGERLEAWARAWRDTFGARALEAAAALLDGGPDTLATSIASVLIALVADRGSADVARRCALAWLGAPDHPALGARLRAALRVTATADDLATALAHPDPRVRRQAATLAERPLSCVDTPRLLEILAAARERETDAIVARLLQRARVTHAFAAACAAPDRTGVTLDACLTREADPERLVPPGRVSTAMLRWRDGIPVTDAAGCVLLDAIGDEDGAREVALVARVRAQLDDASCDAFADQLATLWHGSSVLAPWLPWARARFGSGSRLVRVATEIRRTGDHELAAALLERNGTPDARALLERWRGDAWSWLADGERGVGLASLLDRGVASCGLDAQRRRTVRLGPHKLAIELTADGRTRIVEPRTGAVLPRLPEGGSRDVAGRHVQRRNIRRLREEIETTWKQARERLTEPGRRWTIAAFRRDVLGHPILRAAATTLRWRLLLPDDTSCLFRVLLEDPCVSERDGGPIELVNGVEVSCVGRLESSAG